MAEEIITETNRETATDHAYGGAQIQVLEGLEAVRKRPGMYIGSTGPSGLHHLVYEIVDNAIDEALAGYCTHIEVTIKPGNIIEVSDNGRGIPVDIQPKLGIPAVTVVYTVLHAGGKFGGEDSGYKVAGGLHGVGASVVNALSEWLTVRVRRDGAEYEQSFKRGKPDGDLKKIGAAASTGTTVTFKPDPEMFQETTLYRYETLLKRLREEAFLNAGVKITLTDERPDADRPQDEQHPLLRQLPVRAPRLNAAAPAGHVYEGRGPGRCGRGRTAILRQQLQRAAFELCQQRPHPRGRHPRGGL